MDHTHVSAEQHARVIPKLIAQRAYLGKLVERLRANGFPEDDPLFVAVHKAWEAACRACVAACTCRNKVHGPPPTTSFSTEGL